MTLKLQSRHTVLSFHQASVIFMRHALPVYYIQMIFTAHSHYIHISFTHWIHLTFTAPSHYICHTFYTLAFTAQLHLVNISFDRKSFTFNFFATHERQLDCWWIIDFSFTVSHIIKYIEKHYDINVIMSLPSRCLLADIKIQNVLNLTNSGSSSGWFPLHTKYFEHPEWISEQLRCLPACITSFGFATASIERYTLAPKVCPTFLGSMPNSAGNDLSKNQFGSLHNFGSLLCTESNLIKTLGNHG